MNETDVKDGKDAGWVHLGSSEYQEAKRLQARLEERGIALQLAGNPETCSTGKCKITVEVYVKEEQLPQVKEFFHEERNRVYDGLEFDPSLLEEVYDPDKPTAKCPACGTEFSTQEKACPDCGLAFA